MESGPHRSTGSFAQRHRRSAATTWFAFAACAAPATTLLTASNASAASSAATSAAATAMQARAIDDNPDNALIDRPISSVEIVGLDGADLDLVRNNLRMAAGDPYDPQVARADVNRIYRLGRFGVVEASEQLLADGSVAIVYTITPQPSIRTVEVIGNKRIKSEDIRGVIRQAAGGARDNYLIERAIRDIETLYHGRGYLLADVSIDRRALEDRGVLSFRIIEGPRVRIRGIEFEGAESFSDRLLLRETETRTHILLLRAGVLDEEVLEVDRAALVNFYSDRGFLDVRIDVRTDLSPDNSEAKVIWLVEEGPKYTLGDVRVVNANPDNDPGDPLAVFSAEQLAALIAVRTGDVYSANRVNALREIIEDAYGGLGYDEVRVRAVPSRIGDEPVVDLQLQINEGRRTIIGTIDIQGNFLTKDKVIRRALKLKPGRPYDAQLLRTSRRTIAAGRLFGGVEFTLQPPDDGVVIPGVGPNTVVRDLLVEVDERKTSSLNFGVAAGSDGGVFGDFSFRQDNFDIADTPETVGEFIRGRSFRGAGQRFEMTLRPGNEIFQYSVAFTEPNFLDTDYSLSVRGGYNEREFNDYEEKRVNASVGLGRKYGDFWNASVRLRGERVELSDIRGDAPTELLLDQGPDNLTSVSFGLTRTTIETITRPGAGSRFEVSLERVGAFGGDYDFWRAETEFTGYLTVREDFLGRKSTLKFQTRAGYQFDEDPRVPTYERFYLGGRSFRGFDFRTVSPKGIRIDNGEQADSIGGTWLFFAGLQYETPLFGENVTGVVFVDSGTVTDDPFFDDYRVSAGLGVRLYIPQIGPVPIAFDFGFPILDRSGDERNVLSFSLDFPF